MKMNFLQSCYLAVNIKSGKDVEINRSARLSRHEKFNLDLIALLHLFFEFTSLLSTSSTAAVQISYEILQK